jgi:hypothetical protein
MESIFNIKHPYFSKNVGNNSNNSIASENIKMEWKFVVNKTLFGSIKYNK